MGGMPYPNPTDPELQERMRFMDTQQQHHALRPALVTEHDITAESRLQPHPEMTPALGQDHTDPSTGISSASAQNLAAVKASPIHASVNDVSAQTQAAESGLSQTGVSDAAADNQAAVKATPTQIGASSFSAQKQVAASGSLTAGREYYEDLCMKAVNQCVGRVIRHKGDYAAIVLADARWCSGNAGVAPDTGQMPVAPLRKLPTWIQGSLTVCRSFGDAYERMHRFHRHMLATSTIND